MPVTEGPRIALTFDDGPNPPFTTQIAEFLAFYSIPATFFLCGQNIKKNPQEVRNLRRLGFALGNHSYEHSFLKTAIGLDYAGIQETQRLIEKFGGHQPKIFRAPFGMTAPWTLKRLRDEGFLIAPVRHANMADRRGKFTAGEIVRRVVDHLEDKMILLLHDGDGVSGKRDLTPTVEAVRYIVVEAQRKGFQFVNLFDLLEDMPVPIFYP